MLESYNLNNDLEYQKLSLEEQQSRGILGRLKGVIADFKNPTRNGRKYTEQLWEKTFNDPIMQEKINNKCLFGELGHPADRSEVDMEKIAICLAETPKKGNDGKLYGVFDILATPCGKILKTLCDYGCNIGVSSRGNGDTFTDYDGQETVDADTFECECWDAVLLPAVKEARLKLVTESLTKTNKTLKTALCEALESANNEDKQIMKDKLEELKIDYSPEQDTNNPEKVNNISVSEENENAGNAGDSLVNALQEALKGKQKLEEQLTTLQEKLSVSYAKEAELQESISKYKVAIKSLTESAKKVAPLENQISTLSAQLSEKDNKINSQNSLIKDLRESRVKASAQSKSLNESLINKDSQISGLQKQINTLNKDIERIKSENIKTKETLNENIEELKKDSAIKNSEYSRKITRANQIVEKYKKMANEAVERYIKSQATKLGVSKNDIRSKLSEGFSFDDIDMVCEELQTYKLNISKLPFDISKTKNIKMKITESKEPIKPANRFDDELDDQLKNLAGL